MANWREEENKKRAAKIYQTMVDNYVKTGSIDGASGRKSLGASANELWKQQSPVAGNQLARYNAAGKRVDGNTLQKLTGGVTWKANSLKDYEPEATRQGYLDMLSFINMHRNEGRWDVDTNSASVWSDDFLSEMLGTYPGLIADSEAKDAEWEKNNSNRINNWQKWSDMHNRLAEMTEENAPYYWAYTDYLLNGDTSKPFDMDLYNDAWDEMDDEAFFADQDAKKAQFESVDWEKRLNPRQEEYVSETEKLRLLQERAQAEAEKRKELDQWRQIAEYDGLNGNIEGRLMQELEDYAPYAVGPDGQSATVYKPEYYTNQAYFINNASSNMSGSNILSSLKGRNIFAQWFDEDVTTVEGYLEKGYNYLLPEEIVIYNDLYLQDKRMAQGYLDSLESELLMRRREVQDNLTGLLATDPATGAFMRLARLAAPIANMTQLGVQAIEGYRGTADPNAAYYDFLNAQGAITDAQRAAIMEKDKTGIGAFLYDAANNVEDVVVGLGLGPVGNQILMGSKAASGSLQESATRGIGGIEALARAGGDAAVEALSEKLGVDGAPAKGTKFFRQAAKDALGEGLEEVISNVGSTLTDIGVSAATGRKNAMEEAREEYVIAGAANPTAKVLSDKAKEIGRDFAMGAVAGGVIGGAKAGVQKYQQRVIDRALKAAEKEAQLTTADKEAAEAAKVIVKKGSKVPTSVKMTYDDGNGPVKGEYQRFEKTAGGLLKVVIKGEDGTEKAVTVDDITEAEGAGIAHIIQYSQVAGHAMSEEEANTMATAYRQVGGDAQEFVHGYEGAYLSGYAGITAPESSLPKNISQIAYDAGKAEAVADEKLRKARASKFKAVEDPVAGWLGSVQSNKQLLGMGDQEAISGALEGMTESQRATAEVALEIGKNIGLNMVLYESDGESISEISNGMYDAVNHTVYIDVNTGANTKADVQAMKEQGTLGFAIMRTMGHEVTHYLENTEAYGTYKEHVKNALKEKGESWATLMRGKLENAIKDGRKLTYEGAEAEVIADASEYMLENSTFVQKMEKGLRRKVKTFIQGFMERIRTAFANLVEGHRESSALRETINGVVRYTGKLQEMWDAMLEEIVQKREAQLQAAEMQEAPAAEAVEAVEERIEQTVKASTREAVMDYASAEDEDFHRNGRIYDYDFMVAQKPISVVPIPSVNTLMGSGRFSRSEVAEAGKRSVQGAANEKGHKVVTNVYTGRALTITNNSIRHGLNGSKQRLLANAQIGMVIGDVVENGIPVNGLIPTDSNALQTYAMVTPCITEDGKQMMAVTHVDIQKNEVNSVTFTDIVHSANGRIYKNSEPVSDTIDVEGNGPYHPSRYTISISDLLKDVNMSFKSLLSQDVLEHLGEERPEDGAYSAKVMYSMRDGETAAEAYEKYRQASKRLNDIRSKQRELNDSDEMKTVYKLMESDAEAGAVAYKKLLDSHGLNVNTRELQKQESELYRRWEELRDRELAEEEATEIEKSGKTEAEYRRDKAVKEFGYTPYFYDAGYIVPNGKLLNFSGEKNRHFGSRGQDHRAVSTVYANKTGSEAMVAFMHGGNIRIMPESPGLDIASSVEPTAQQYTTIRKFVREYGEDEYLNIDFTNEMGNVVANLEYEGRIYPDRVVNDIKHYFETGEIREQGISAFMHSTRDLAPSISIRETLGAMEPTSRMTETERLLLKQYQDKLKVLQEKEHAIDEQEKILKTAHGDDILKTKNRIKVLRAQANRASRLLTAAERSDGFAGLMATGRQMVQNYLQGSGGAVADAVDQLEEEISGLRKHLQTLGASVESAAYGQKAAFARGLFDQAQLNAAAQQLKDNYGSRMSVKTIADRLALAYGELYAGDGAEGAKVFSEEIRNLAEDLLRGNKYRYKSEILPMLEEKIGSISLSETDEQEIRNAGYTLGAYKRMLSPYIRVTENGSDLSSYASNAQYYGEGELGTILGEETEGNLAMRLYDVISQEKAKEASIAYEGMSEGELIGMVMADIAGANLPMSTSDTTITYLRNELKKYAGESQEAAQAIEGALEKAKSATMRAGKVWRAAVEEVQIVHDVVEYYRKLEEQRRLTELAEQKQAITDQLKTEGARKLQEKVEEQRAEYREREQRAREYRRTRDEVVKLRNQISRDVKRMNNLRLRETDQKHVPQELQYMVDEVMRTFTESGLSRLAFSKEKTASLIRQYDILRTLETDATYFWDDEIEQDLQQLSALSEQYTALTTKADGNPAHYYSLEGVEMEQEILRSVQAIIGNVMKMVNRANEQFLAGKQETFNEYANGAGKELGEHKNAKRRLGKLGEWQDTLDEWLRTGNMTPVYFFKHLKNEHLQEVFDQVRKGQSKYGQIVREGRAYVQAQMEKYHYGAWAEGGKLKLKTGQGHEITLTREQAMWVYATAKREEANKMYQTQHLLVGGFQYKDLSEVEGEEKGTRATDKPHSLDKADVEKIGSWLTEEQKAYADAMVKYLSETMADYGNEAAMDMFGYKKFLEKYYFPFQTKASQRFQKGDEGPQGESAGTGRVLNSGFTKKLTYSANTTLVMDDFTKVITDHIQQMATYDSMVQPIENLKRLLNHKMIEEDGTINTIRAMIGQKYGSASEAYLNTLLKDLNGAVQGDQRAIKGPNKLIGAFKRGAVMASASVVLQQPTAVARAMAYISPKYFAVNPLYRPGKGTWETMMKHSGTAVIKDMGKFDVGLGMTASQYMRDEHLNALETWRRLKGESKTKAGQEAFRRAIDWLTAAPGKADQWTWGIIWKAVENEQAELHPDMDRNSDAFLDIVGARFDDVIDQTQVYDSVLTRSDLMRSKNAMHQMATSFMSEPTLSLNMLYDAVKGNHSKAKRVGIIASVAASQVLAGAMAALVQAWNDDKDKRNFAEKYADAALGNIADNLNPLGMIPYISDIVSILQGYDVERADMSVISTLSKYTLSFANKVINGETLTLKDWENFAGNWANLTGIPAKNIMREIRRTINAVTNTQWNTPSASNLGFIAKENMKLLGIIPLYSGKNTAYYERAVAADLRGDTAYAEDLREYMLTSKMVTEDKLTEGLQTAMKNAFIAGDTDEDTAIAYLVTIGAKDDANDAYWEVDKWKEMRDTGIKAGDYRKYSDFFQAVETGENLKAVVQEYLDHGVEKSTLASQITNQYKEQYIALYKAGKMGELANMQARILTAYQVLGYDRTEKLKDVQKWIK